MFSLSLTLEIVDMTNVKPDMVFLTCWRQAFAWRQHWAPHVVPGVQTPSPENQMSQHFLIFSYPYISRVDLFAEVGGELALLEGEEVDGSEDDHDDPADTSVDSEDDFRPCNWNESESWQLHRHIHWFWRWFVSLQLPADEWVYALCSLLSLQLTVGLYEHSAKDGTTEAAKTMVNTLNKTHL